jgi:hypothetical protein
VSRIARGAVLLLAVAPLAAPGARAAEWGGIIPGTSTMETVRQRHGAPSREARQKVEGYDTVQWVYDAGRAPAGMTRMTVEFGILTPAGYRPRVVRYFILEPKPRVFHRGAVLAGWGAPDLMGEVEGRPLFVYKSGLQVTLDPNGEDAVSLLFAPPQPDPPPARR